MKIYLVRQHVQVGDECILGVALNKGTADNAADRYNEKTGTKNFDVIEMVSGEFPDPSTVFSN
jgi:hypothetical protein